MNRFFRGERFIDRENELDFFLNWFENRPRLILWVYGPRSSVKTTLIEYIVENELSEDFQKLQPKAGHWVRYINLRRYLIADYGNFMEAFVKPETGRQRKEEKLDAGISTGIFQIKASLLNEIKEHKQDLFKVLISELQGISREKRR